MDIQHHPKRLFDFLAHHGVTHADIASFLDVSVSAVSSWSVERRRMPLGCFTPLLLYAFQQTTQLMDSPPFTEPLDLDAYQRFLTSCLELRELYEEQRLVYEAAYRDIAQARDVLADLVKDHPPETWTADTVQRVLHASRQFNSTLQEAIALKVLPVSAQIDTGARQCEKVIAHLEALIQRTQLMKKGKKNATTYQRRKRPSQPNSRSRDVPSAPTPRPNTKRLRTTTRDGTGGVRANQAPG